MSVFLLLFKVFLCSLFKNVIYSYKYKLLVIYNSQIYSHVWFSKYADIYFKWIGNLLTLQRPPEFGT